MADDARHPPADLTAGLDEAGIAALDFFAALAAMETDELRFGRSGGPEREPARLGQPARLAFSTQDVTRIRRGEGKVPPKVDVEVLGLLGPEGPMPLHITRWVMIRLSDRWFSGETDAASDTTFLDFCNMLQHRLMALYWRAWGDARAEVQAAHRGGGRLAATLAALAGTGLPGMAGRDAGFDRLKLAHASSLSSAVHGPERLARFVAEAIRAPVRLVEFVGHWLPIPPALQTRLGMAHAGLGTGAVAGARSFQRQTRVELRIGPLPLDRFTAFLPGTEGLARLREAVLFASGHEAAADVRLVLAAADVPAARLGNAMLGRTSWLAPKGDRDADDLCIHAVTGLAA